MYAAVDRAADEVVSLVSGALQAEGVAHAVQRVGNLFGFAFGDGAALGWTGESGGPADESQVKRQEAYRYAPFFHAMLDGGVSLAPSVFEAWFCSAAHDDAALERIAAAVPAAARAAAAARPDEG